MSITPIPAMPLLAPRPLAIIPVLIRMHLRCILRLHSAQERPTLELLVAIWPMPKDIDLTIPWIICHTYVAVVWLFRSPKGVVDAASVRDVAFHVDECDTAADDFVLAAFTVVFEVVD